jgi:predicted nucleotidyltransferase component of viral defense system
VRGDKKLLYENDYNCMLYSWIMERFLKRIKQLTLIALFSDNDLLDILVLKGGTALEFYDLDYRLSIDLDFSIESEFEHSLSLMQEKIETALESTFREEGYTVFDVILAEKPKQRSAEMADFWGGYSIEFKIIKMEKYDKLSNNIDKLRRGADVVGSSNKKKIMIDISKFEYCQPKQAKELEGYTIYIYTSAMIIGEKIRAICQQMPEYREIVLSSSQSARARDFYDIYILSERYGIDLTTPEHILLLEKIFAAKRVPLNLIASIKETKEFHREDFTAVRATVGGSADLKDFDFYFNYVADYCRVISEALGIE